MKVNDLRKLLSDHETEVQTLRYILHVMNGVIEEWGDLKPTEAFAELRKLIAEAKQTVEKL